MQYIAFYYGFAECKIDTLLFDFWLYFETSIYVPLALSRKHILLSKYQATCSISVLLGDFAL
jgi:hypothetical protein